MKLVPTITKLPWYIILISFCLTPIAFIFPKTRKYAINCFILELIFVLIFLILYTIGYYVGLHTDFDTTSFNSWEQHEGWREHRSRESYISKSQLQDSLIFDEHHKSNSLIINLQRLHHDTLTVNCFTKDINYDLKNKIIFISDAYIQFPKGHFFNIDSSYLLSPFTGNYFENLITSVSLGVYSQDLASFNDGTKYKDLANLVNEDIGWGTYILCWSGYLFGYRVGLQKQVDKYKKQEFERLNKIYGEESGYMKRMQDDDVLELMYRLRQEGLRMHEKTTK